MKKKRFLLGMLVLTLIFGIMVLGCDNGSTGGGGGGGNLPPTSGEFTFTNIPAKYNGKYAVLVGFAEDVRGGLHFEKEVRGLKGCTFSTNDSETITCVRIGNVSVKIPLYEPLYELGELKALKAYSGNDSLFVGIAVFNNEVISVNSNSPLAAAYFGNFIELGDGSKVPTSFPVKFTNGKATKSNNEANTKLN